MDWARCSGFWSRSDNKGSNDKPKFNFGVPALDDLSVRKLINIVAPIVPRNYVVMEVKSNLLASDRQETLKKFSNPCYKKVAQVVMGQPNKDFKDMVQSKLLKEKQEKVSADWKREQERKAKERQRRKEEKEREARRKERDAQEKKAREERSGE